jgi:hypothetical protein
MTNIRWITFKVDFGQIEEPDPINNPLDCVVDIPWDEVIETLSRELKSPLTIMPLTDYEGAGS